VSLDLHVAHVWELRDGKLLRGTVYLDPEAALEAVEAATG
jgi:ketosteroid isomerase-like protein